MDESREKKKARGTNPYSHEYASDVFWPLGEIFVRSTGACLL
mgnify:CR=1 FL=1